MSHSNRCRLTLVYGAALFSADLPLKARVDSLAKFITPRPGAELFIDEYVAKEFGKKDRGRGTLYGFIEVNPPKGRCFTITTSEERQDVEICKKTSLKWYLQDLDRHTGKLAWTVKTGPGDYGTPLEWHTNYIIAKVIPSTKNFDEAYSTPVFIKACRAIASDSSVGRGRRIELDLFDGRKWLIRFPDEDAIIPMPTPVPTPPPEEKKPEHGEAEGHEKKEGEGEAKPSPSTTPAPPPPEAWTMSSRHGYFMDVSGLLTGVSTPPGTKGKCRYEYENSSGAPNSGRIECHYSDEFTYFYAPLPCIKNLQRK